MKKKVTTKERGDFSIAVSNAKTEKEVNDIMVKVRAAEAENLTKAQNEAREYIARSKNLTAKEKGDFSIAVSNATSVKEVDAIMKDVKEAEANFALNKAKEDAKDELTAAYEAAIANLLTNRMDKRNKTYCFRKCL